MNTNEKLREVLDEADTVLSALGYDATTPIRSQIKQALALPRRNCDVGTEEEQSDRFLQYCTDITNGTGICKKCPLRINNKGCCYFIWAQLPYEEVKHDKDYK